MQFRLFLQPLSVGTLLVLGLTACDGHHPEPAISHSQTQPKPVEAAVSTVLVDDQAVSSEVVALTQVAGQATIPHVVSKRMEKPSQQDLIYAGRYHARIPCSDPFAGCVSNEKEAEYIINLLEDGSVYWINTSFGRLGSDPSRDMTKIEQMCKQVQWHAHKELNEIMIRCENANVNLYYKINKEQNLVLDLDKIWNGDHGRNRQFFKEYPFPKKAYVFEKIE
ncbi:hypothetical protein IRT38_04925 [Acinetobacter sp. SK-43]|uniref:hypothetical protein n=1 Tax=Acinetobacter sp. SK-43 TaxID=2785295 RepID=UPI00188D1DCC|nr:hypothetical protein [Acinetobacter sp. SK-43]MBF4454742.1 hypothetical protein [Acinetobacter sp. SK-43]